MKTNELLGLLEYLEPAERAELEELLAEDLRTVVWRPLPGPQTLAYYSTADVIGFGGAAGGGKTDLACGKALTQHYTAQVFRREGTELTAIVDRMVEILGHRDGLGGKPPIWRDPTGECHLIEFGSVPNLGDEKKYQGRAKDLLVIDEAANFLEQQVRFLMGWVRSTRPGQRCQTLMCFNPPTSADGRWIVKFFAPWLDKKYTGPRAKPGEVLYVGVVPSASGVSRDVWFGTKNPGQFIVVDGEPIFDFNPDDHPPEDIVTPQTRTFIPAKVTDNPHLANTGYMAQLQALPEPLRSQMLRGDFEAGMTDDPWQVIPTAWVEAAMARWKQRDRKGEMMALGVDVARGGKDQTVIAARHKIPDQGYESGTDLWFDKLRMHPGKETPDGNAVAGLVIAERRDLAPVMIDVIGVGSSPYDILKNAGQDVYGINVAQGSTETDTSGMLTFFNLRSQLWWQMREALDPAANNGIALPDDPELLAELCAPRWKLSGKEIKVESREEIIDRVGRSPDRASAVILALIDMPKIQHIGNRNDSQARARVLTYNPLDNSTPAQSQSPLSYDPLRGV